jgi:pimeloyl-ACP methyl ester carboxylesterase
MAASGATERFVDSSDGVRVAVYEHGNPDGPPLVLVHGWPDSHVMWDGVVPLLADRFRIIRYDNRGVGKTSAPKDASAYSTVGYADDFAAVVAELSPGAPVHVLAHDWGSIGMWEYLSRHGASDRVASFTSVSGPSADHTLTYLRGGLRRPYRPKSFLQAGSQFARLGYMVVFTIPVLPALAIRTFGADVIRRYVTGVPEPQRHYSDNFPADAANSIKLYRANVFKSIARPRRDHYVDVPVQLIVNTCDPFIRPHAFDHIKDWVPRLWRREIKAGHWSPMSHPHVLAESVREFVDVVDGKPA